MSRAIIQISRLIRVSGGDRAGQDAVYASSGCPSTCVGESLFVPAKNFGSVAHFGSFEQITSIITPRHL
jgi:hypothetical protein